MLSFAEIADICFVLPEDEDYYGQEYEEEEECY